jgi:replicative DNA helicase
MEFGGRLGEVFTDNIALALYGHIESLHTAVDGDFTLQDLRVNVIGQYRQGETRADELLEVIDGIEETPEVNSGALRHSVDKFTKREYLAKAAQYIATNLSEDNLDAGIAYDLVQRAVDIGQGVNSEIMDLSESGVPGEVDDRSAICSLGISPELDSCLGGGVASGELLLFLAPPCRGKTSYLCAVGARAAAQGRKVLHVTLEIAARRVARRYDATLTGLTRVEMIDRPRTVVAGRTQLTKAGGFVKIKDWSYMDVCPNDVKALVKRMRAKGDEVDLVIIDYLELMVSNPKQRFARREQRHEYGQLGKDIRAASVELDLPVITAWQVNRQGSNLDVVNLEHVSECWDIIKHADIILGMNQSAEELRNAQLRMGVLKQRDGTNRPTVTLHSDLDRNQVRDLRDREIVTDITIGGSDGT